VYWYQKAANQGQAEAQYNLGIAYTFGKGVLKDYNLYQKHMQSQDWIVLLHTPDQLLFDTNTQIAYHLLTHWKRCVKRL
jgi:hypothetical protein